MNTHEDISRCECNDIACFRHQNSSECTGVGLVVLYRTDLEDRTGTLFCDECACDALDSGLFMECDAEEFTTNGDSDSTLEPEY